eukprot:1861279-Pyramimonas_sp.AAC.1
MPDSCTCTREGWPFGETGRTGNSEWHRAAADLVHGKAHRLLGVGVAHSAGAGHGQRKPVHKARDGKLGALQGAGSAGGVTEGYPGQQREVGEVTWAAALRAGSGLLPTLVEARTELLLQRTLPLAAHGGKLNRRLHLGQGACTVVHQRVLHLVQRVLAHGAGGVGARSVDSDNTASDAVVHGCDQHRQKGATRGLGATDGQLIDSIRAQHARAREEQIRRRARAGGVEELIGLRHIQSEAHRMSVITLLTPHRSGQGETRFTAPHLLALLRTRTTTARSCELQACVPRTRRIVTAGVAKGMEPCRWTYRN